MWYIYYYFSENLIKSACLNTAQNLISDINTQSEHFVTLVKRLIEVKKESSSGSILYGIEYIMIIQ